MRYLIFLAFVSLIACGDGRNFTRVDIKDVDHDHRVLADYILDVITLHCDSGNFNEFAQYSYITPKMYQLLQYGDFSNTCEVLNEHIGMVQSKELKEVYYYNGILQLFRYKVVCEKQAQPLEFRVALTIGEGKLSEYRFYEWQDTFDKEIIRMKWF